MIKLQVTQTKDHPNRSLVHYTFIQWIELTLFYRENSGRHRFQGAPNRKRLITRRSIRWISSKTIETWCFLHPYSLTKVTKASHTQPQSLFHKKWEQPLGSCRRCWHTNKIDMNLIQYGRLNTPCTQPSRSHFKHILLENVIIGRFFHKYCSQASDQLI